MILLRAVYSVVELNRICGANMNEQDEHDTYTDRDAKWKKEE